MSRFDVERADVGMDDEPVWRVLAQKVEADGARAALREALHGQPWKVTAYGPEVSVVPQRTVAGHYRVVEHTEHGASWTEEFVVGTRTVLEVRTAAEFEAEMAEASF